MRQLKTPAKALLSRQAMSLTGGPRIGGDVSMLAVSRKPLERLAVVTLRMSSTTMEDIRALTTEGHDRAQREAFTLDLANAHGSGVFEMSTCNRVVYAGLCDDVAQLKATVEKVSGVALTDVVEFTAEEAWEHLVMVASGLDAFVLGELQVLGQVRSAIEHHRQSRHADAELLGVLEHVVWASRLVRKHLGFTKTTASMLNLATLSLDAMMAKGGLSGCVVLGSGDMGRKAVEALLERNVPVTVVSRYPERAQDRFGPDGSKVTFMDFEAWSDSPPVAPLIISTMRVATPVYGAKQRLPTAEPLTVMDFSWPPSIDPEGLHPSQTLQGMNHWIQQAHGLNEAVDRPALLAEARQELSRIHGLLETRLASAGQSDFRSFVHHTFAKLAAGWVASPLNAPPNTPELEAFGRELATWLCKAHGTIVLDDVRERVQTTARPLSASMLERIEDDVIQVIGDLHDHLPPSEVRT